MCSICGDSGHTAEEHTARARVVGGWHGGSPPNIRAPPPTVSPSLPLAHAVLTFDPRPQHNGSPTLHPDALKTAANGAIALLRVRKGSWDAS